MKNIQFDILHDINEIVTLVKLVNSAGDFNHAVSIFSY